MPRSALLLAAALAAGSALGAGPGAAQAGSCPRVVAGTSVFTRISVHDGVRCAGARRKLRRWARHGFPRRQTGWYCDTSRPRKLCSRGNGNAPYFTFRQRPRARALARSAARRPHRGERRAIARAIRRSRSTRGVRGMFTIARVRISTVDRRWGAVLLKPKRRFRRQLDSATAVVHRSHRRWRVRTLGTAELGCAIDRRAVRRDLSLGCASG